MLNSVTSQCFYLTMKAVSLSNYVVSKLHITFNEHPLAESQSTQNNETKPTDKGTFKKFQISDIQWFKG